MMIADINLQQLQLTLVIGNQLAVIAFKMRNTAGNQVTSQLIAFFTQNDRMTSECTHPCCFQSCNTAADNEYGFLCTGCSNAVNFLTSARRIYCTANRTIGNSSQTALMTAQTWPDFIRSSRSDLFCELRIRQQRTSVADNITAILQCLHCHIRIIHPPG